MGARCCACGVAWVGVALVDVLIAECAFVSLFAVADVGCAIVCARFGACGVAWVGVAGWFDFAEFTRVSGWAVALAQWCLWCLCSVAVLAWCAFAGVRVSGERARVSVSAFVVCADVDVCLALVSVVCVYDVVCGPRESVGVADDLIGALFVDARAFGITDSECYGVGLIFAVV